MTSRPQDMDSTPQEMTFTPQDTISTPQDPKYAPQGHGVTPSTAQSQSPPPRRSPGTSGLDGVAGLGSPEFPFRPDAPEPRGFHDDMSISDRDNDLYVATDQPGTDLAQRGLCAAEIRVKTKPNVKKIEVDPLDVFSRAAPKRPHEAGPFLSINTLSKDKQHELNAHAEYLSSRTQMSDRQGKHPQRTNTPSAQSGSRGSLSEWNPMVPRPSKKYSAPASANLHTKAPFKHSVTNPSKEQVKREKRSVSPSSAMKEIMSRATYQVAHNVAKQPTQQKPVQNGKLLKGRLQPLNVVQKQGPNMDQCRGIVPDTRETVPSSSKTLQRRRQVYTDHMMKADPYDRPHTQESVHRPSIASDITDAATLDADLAELDKIRQEKEEIANFMREQGYGQNAATPSDQVAMEPSDQIQPAASVGTADQTGHHSSTRSPMPPGYVNGMERPKTVSDSTSRKSVRFDESSTNSELSRSKSANPRIRTASGCKPFDAGKREPDGDGDEDGRKQPQDKENAIPTSHRNGSTSQAQNSSNRPASTSSAGKQTKCNAVMVNDFAAFSNGPPFSLHTEHAPSVCSELASNAESGYESSVVQNEENRLSRTQHIPGYHPSDKIYERRARRPVSAKISRPKTKKKMIRRPQSAKAALTCVLANENLELPEDYVCHRSAGGRPLSARDHRPILGLQLAINAPVTNVSDSIHTIEMDVKNRDDNADNIVALCGTTLPGNAKQEISRPDINYSNIKPKNYAHVKSTIPRQNRVKHKSATKQITYEPMNYGKTTSNDDILNVRTDKDGGNAETFVTQLCTDDVGGREVGQSDVGQSAGGQSEVGQSEVGQNSEREDVLLNLESLEESLENVQCEIQKCLQKVLSHRDVASDGDVQSSSEQSADQTGSTQSVEESSGHKSSLQDIGLTPGELSESLTHTQTGSYKMKVYHYDADRDAPSSGDVNVEDRNGERTNRATEQHDGALSSGTETGELISNYDVTFMQQLNPVDKEDMSGNSTDGCPLEVQATAAVLNKARHDKSQPTEHLQPPVCFKINARPPEGYLYYFAYGLDMNTNRMSVYLQRDMHDRLWGLLFGFKLVFNKKGVDLEAGLFPNLEFNPHSSVEGCLYLITPEELTKLDNYMGYPEHYEHVALPIWLLNCDAPEELGIAQYCVAGLMYVAQDLWVQKGDLDPHLSEHNMKQCALNSDLLSTQYRDHIINSMP